VLRRRFGTRRRPLRYLAGRRVVVIGAGTVAQRRLPRLVAVSAEVLLIAPEATPAVEAMATAGELCWEVRCYADGDLKGAWYALACSSDPAVNAAVAAEAQRRRVFCVRADEASGGSAVTAATGEHEGLLIGVLAARVAPLPSGTRWSTPCARGWSMTPRMLRTMSRLQGWRSSVLGPATPT
jgi:siroheme synthase-like protein